MPAIETLPFKKEKFNQIKSRHYGLNWPVVYLIEDGSEMYIGETVSIYNRSNQHYENPERRKLNKIHIITDEEYNVSATLDIESSLIQYLSAEGSYLIQNKNHGILNHNYYDRQRYKAKFEIVWKELMKSSLVKKDLVQIRNSDLFKYSPYKALTEEQLVIVNTLLEQFKLSSTGTLIVHGGAGTGKTIVATYLLKMLKDFEDIKDLKIGLVVPMTALRNTIRQVFKNVKGLSVSMVIGPSEVVKHKYDILIVDEAHRLKKRKNITNYKSFDTINKRLGLGKNGTELDWILRSSKHQILFYDEGQSIRPSDISSEVFKSLKGKSFQLKNQLRVKGGEEYLDFINNLFDLKRFNQYKFPDYDFKIYNDIHQMVKDIKQKDKKLGLSRMVSGYAWPWVSKNNPDQHDIEIDGLKLFWNSVNHNWVNSPNAVNEVGCIHTVQGYDLNYAGVIIGPELSYDEKKKELVIFSEKYMDINGRRGVDNPKELERYIINIYKTLLARGIYGTYVYIVDKKLEKYLKTRLKKYLLH